MKKKTKKEVPSKPKTKAEKDDFFEQHKKVPVFYQTIRETHRARGGKYDVIVTLRYTKGMSRGEEYILGYVSEVILRDHRILYTKGYGTGGQAHELLDENACRVLLSHYLKECAKQEDNYHGF